MTRAHSTGILKGMENTSGRRQQMAPTHGAEQQPRDAITIALRSVALAQRRCRRAERRLRKAEAVLRLARLRLADLVERHD
jgi:hypothetical protein